MTEAINRQNAIKCKYTPPVASGTAFVVISVALAAIICTSHLPLIGFTGAIVLGSVGFVSLAVTAVSLYLLKKEEKKPKNLPIDDEKNPAPTQAQAPASQPSNPIPTQAPAARAPSPAPTQAQAQAPASQPSTPLPNSLKGESSSPVNSPRPSPLLDDGEEYEHTFPQTIPVAVPSVLYPITTGLDYVTAGVGYVTAGASYLTSWFYSSSESPSEEPTTTPPAETTSTTLPPSAPINPPKQEAPTREASPSTETTSTEPVNTLLDLNQLQKDLEPLFEAYTTFVKQLLRYQNPQINLTSVEAGLDKVKMIIIEILNDNGQLEAFVRKETPGVSNEEMPQAISDYLIKYHRVILYVNLNILMENLAWIFGLNRWALSGAAVAPRNTINQTRAYAEKEYIPNSLFANRKASLLEALDSILPTLVPTMISSAQNKKHPFQKEFTKGWKMPHNESNSWKEGIDFYIKFFYSFTAKLAR